MCDLTFPSCLYKVTMYHMGSILTLQMSFRNILRYLGNIYQKIIFYTYKCIYSNDSTSLQKPHI